MHQRCHDITGNMTYLNFCIEDTTFPEMSFQNEAILIYNIMKNFLEDNWGRQSWYVQGFHEFIGQDNYLYLSLF
jgi:hypothetical protein